MTPVRSVISRLLIRLHTRNSNDRQLYLTAHRSNATIKLKRHQRLTPSQASIHNNAPVRTCTLIRSATTRDIALRVIMVSINRNVLLLGLLYYRVTVINNVLLLRLYRSHLRNLHADILIRHLLNSIMHLKVRRIISLLPRNVIIRLITMLTLRINTGLLRGLRLRNALQLSNFIDNLRNIRRIGLLRLFRLTLGRRSILHHDTCRRVRIYLDRLNGHKISSVLSISPHRARLKSKTLGKSITTHRHAQHHWTHWHVKLIRAVNKRRSSIRGRLHIRINERRKSWNTIRWTTRRSLLITKLALALNRTPQRPPDDNVLLTMLRLRQRGVYSKLYVLNDARNNWRGNITWLCYTEPVNLLNWFTDLSDSLPPVERKSYLHGGIRFGLVRTLYFVEWCYPWFHYTGMRGGSHAKGRYVIFWLGFVLTAEVCWLYSPPGAGGVRSL